MQSFLFTSKIIHTLNQDNHILLDPHLENSYSCLPLLLGTWPRPRQCQGCVSAAWGNQQNPTEPAYYSEQNITFVCKSCCRCFKLRGSASAAPSKPGFNPGIWLACFYVEHPFLSICETVPSSAFIFEAMEEHTSGPRAHSLSQPSWNCSNYTSGLLGSIGGHFSSGHYTYI